MIKPKKEKKSLVLKSLMAGCGGVGIWLQLGLGLPFNLSQWWATFLQLQPKISCDFCRGPHSQLQLEGTYPVYTCIHIIGFFSSEGLVGQPHKNLLPQAVGCPPL